MKKTLALTALAATLTFAGTSNAAVLSPTQSEAQPRVEQPNVETQPEAFAHKVRRGKLINLDHKVRNGRLIHLDHNVRKGRLINLAHTVRNGRLIITDKND